MRSAILCLIFFSFILSWILTRWLRSLCPRLGFVDKPGGRKIHSNPRPLGGGIAIFWGLTLPILIGLAYVHFFPPPAFLQSPRWLGTVMASQLPAYWSGIRDQTPLALAILLTGGAMHALGLMDDRKAMGPYSKLIIQLSIITALVALGNIRVLTFLDHAGPLAAHLIGTLTAGKLLSIALSVLWIGAITNAFNFLDNMDGLSAGVACVCAVAFLVAALSIGQWFVAAALALLVGSLLGFLWHNFPPAKIFMGDSGSLLIGFFLGVLTVRTTYLPAGATWSNDWYAVFAPVIVLALPLYDLVVVSAIRLMRGKSPFVGDTNHFSHRLVNRGMSRRTAVLCLYLVTAATSIGAIVLPHVSGEFALLIVLQTVLILCMVALLEQHPLPQPPGESR